MASRGGGIDYSKWDKMEFDDSSDDDDDDGGGGGGGSDDEGTRGDRRPRVTRLDGPGRVTRTPDGTIRIDPSAAADDIAVPAAAAAAGSGKVRADGGGRVGSAPSEGKRGGGGGGGPVRAETSSGDGVPDRFARGGGSFVDPSTGSRVHWSQDRSEATIRVAFDSDVVPSRGVRVELTGALPYADRCAAVGSGGSGGSAAAGVGGRSRGTLVVSGRRRGGGGKGGEEERVVLLSGELPHFVHLAEDEDEVDWEIENLGGGTGRLVRVTLRKAVPMEGVCIWWDRPLEHCPKIDVETIEARKKKTVGGSTGGQKSQQELVKEAWDEAHKMFCEKIKSRQKETIHLKEDNDVNE